MKTNLSLEEAVALVTEDFRVHGYRPVRESNLVPSQMLVMVDIERYCESRMDPKYPSGCTAVKLDSTPVMPSKLDPSRKTVFYHCVNPPWNGQCFVPLRDILRTVYEHDSDPFANDTRYFVKV